MGYKIRTEPMFTLWFPSALQKHNRTSAEPQTKNLGVSGETSASNKSSMFTVSLYFCRLKQRHHHAVISIVPEDKHISIENLLRN